MLAIAGLDLDLTELRSLAVSKSVQGFLASNAVKTKTVDQQTTKNTIQMPTSQTIATVADISNSSTDCIVAAAATDGSDSVQSYQSSLPLSHQVLEEQQQQKSTQLLPLTPHAYTAVPPPTGIPQLSSADTTTASMTLSPRRRLSVQVQKQQKPIHTHGMTANAHVNSNLDYQGRAHLFHPPGGVDASGNGNGHDDGDCDGVLSEHAASSSNDSGTTVNQVDYVLHQHKQQQQKQQQLLCAESGSSASWDGSSSSTISGIEMSAARGDRRSIAVAAAAAMMAAAGAVADEFRGELPPLKKSVVAVSGAAVASTASAAEFGIGSMKKKVGMTAPSLPPQFQIPFSMLKGEKVVIKKIVEPLPMIVATGQKTSPWTKRVKGAKILREKLLKDMK